MRPEQVVNDFRRNDEQAIRDSVNTWLEASKKGDLPTLLRLMADDVLFITPGREPFGKEAFTSTSDKMAGSSMETDLEIQEIELADGWAWMRSFLRMTMTPAGGSPVKHSGHILTIWQKNSAGNWVIKRDANFVAPEA